MWNLLLLLSVWAILNGYVESQSAATIIESLLSGHNSKERPGFTTSEPANVTINIGINDISKVDEVDMSYHVDIYLRQWWIDPRLASPLLNETFTLSYKDYDRIWVPDIFFSNEQGATFHKITVPNRLLRLSPTGKILYSQRLSLTLACTMDLIRYPMDNQTCKIVVESYAYSERDLVMQWDISGAPLGNSSSLELPEFKITDMSTGTCTFTNPTTGTFSCLYGEIRFQRDLGYYITQLFVPSILVVMLSWVNFWIDAAAVPARVSLALLTIVTITTQNSGIGARLPRVSYTKAIDVWMAVCLFFVFAGLLEYCLVNVFNRKDKEDPLYSEEDDGNEFDEVEQLELADTILNSGANEGAGSTFAGKKSIVTWTKSVQLKQKKAEVPLRRKVRIAVRKKWRRWARTRGMLVDVISRILFPTFFILFNIFYWLYYVVYGANLHI